MGEIAGLLEESESSSRKIVSNEIELANYLLDNFGITIPDVKICPNHTTPWRAFADAYFCKGTVTVWKASRGFGGKSYLLAALGLVEAATLGSDVNILGGSGGQSKNVNDYITGFVSRPTAPHKLLEKDPKQYEIKFTNGARIRALMASSTSVRGPHIQRLRMDEIDEMNLRILNAALGQPMSRDGVKAQTVLSSTHHYADGTMTEILKRANEKRWGVYEWCWRESYAEGKGWLDYSEVEDKRDNTVSKLMWDTEYELQDPNPTERAIDAACLATTFKKTLGEYVGAANEYLEFEPPVSGAMYANGADWARTTDWTIILTFRTDILPLRLVAFERTGRLPWPVMVKKYNDRCLRYPGSNAHDATGLGDVIDGYLESDAQGNIMSGRFRSEMLSRYIAALESGLFEMPFIDYMESEHRLASYNDIYGTGHLPDTISAGANAFTVIEYYDRSSYAGLGKVDDYTNPYD